MKAATVAPALLALGSLLSACGRTAETMTSGEPGPEVPVSATPGEGPNGAKPPPVKPRPGQADVRPIAWQSARPKGPRKVLVRFTSGVEPCHVLDHVDVRYGKTKIEITLFEGHEPGSEDVACIEIAEDKRTVVALDQAVGGRKLVDGTD